MEPERGEDGEESGAEPPDPPILPLSAEHIDRHGMYLMDAGTALYLWVGRAISDSLCQQVRLNLVILCVNATAWYLVHEHGAGPLLNERSYHFHK